jgi:hypothetical protein
MALASTMTGLPPVRMRCPWLGTLKKIDLTPLRFSQFRGGDQVSGRKNRQENSQRGSLLSHLAGEIFANSYKWPQLLSFFFLNNPKSLFINPLPRADGNKFDLSRLFDPVYYSEGTHSETS